MGEFDPGVTLGIAINPPRRSGRRASAGDAAADSRHARARSRPGGAEISDESLDPILAEGASAGGAARFPAASQRGKPRASIVARRGAHARRGARCAQVEAASARLARARPLPWIAASTRAARRKSARRAPLPRASRACRVPRRDVVLHQMVSRGGATRGVDPANDWRLRAARSPAPPAARASRASPRSTSRPRASTATLRWLRRRCSSRRDATGARRPRIARKARAAQLFEQSALPHGEQPPREARRRPGSVAVGIDEDRVRECKGRESRKQRRRSRRRRPPPRPSRSHRARSAGEARAAPPRSARGARAARPGRRAPADRHQGAARTWAVTASRPRKRSPIPASPSATSSSGPVVP
jgi:hypothetical protein